MELTTVQGHIKQIGNYILESELGEGQFGKVFKGREKNTKALYAIKRIDKKKINANPLLPGLLSTEIKIMQEIEHPNILHCFEVIESKTHYYLVLNYCNQGDLENYMREKHLNYFPEEEAIGLFTQIVNGFIVLRQKNIIHRDFKLANIFMSNEVLVIGDFGLAKMGSEMASTVLGTPLTMAPELFEVNDIGGNYTAKADIWSIGVVYYQLLFGNYPYTGYDRPSIYKNMKKVTGDKLEFPKEVSQESRDVLRKMLTVDVNARINWPDLFKHPVFEKKKTIKPNLVDGMTQLLKAFNTTTIITNDMIDPNAQFQKNKKQMNNEDQFNELTPDKMINKIITKKIEEERPIDVDLEKQLINEMAIKEIEFTYNHERNKILFLVFSVKHIQFELTRPECFIYADPFFYASMLILKKARVLNEGLIFNLKARSNIFRIQSEYWNMFISQDHINVVINNFAILSSQLKDYFDIVTRRTEINYLQTNRYDSLLLSMNPSLGEVDNALNSERNKIISIRNGDPKISQDNIHQLRIDCLLKLIEVSTNSEQNLKYIVQTPNGLKKFNINEYYLQIVKFVEKPFY